MSEGICSLRNESAMCSGSHFYYCKAIPNYTKKSLNLGFDLHINEVVAEASKRLHILRVLKHSGVPPANLLKVDFALIRSVLECCCPVWHNALPVKLPDSIKRVQKRALRINFPALHYQEALATTSCSTDSVAGAWPLVSQQRQAIPYTLQN